MGETQSLLSRSSQPRVGSREKRHHQTPPAPPSMETELVSKSRAQGSAA